MLTAREMKNLLDRHGLAPRKRFGQCFLVDSNLMGKILTTAELTGEETVLEVGPATGSLTEDLLPHCKRLVAAEIDRGLAKVLTERLGEDPKLTIWLGDVLASKHAIAPEVLAALDSVNHLVSNLPYNIATPLLAECLLQSHRAQAGDSEAKRFDRMTFTVQREVADRLAGEPSTGDYGPISVIVALLGAIKPGSIVPASAFWPAPKVQSRIMRIDFDPARASQIADAAMLTSVLRAAFGQRRKQLGAIFKKGLPELALEASTILDALHTAGIDPTSRGEQLAPDAFAALANTLSGAR
jgi:16S rRNA (adenine1518-N6/adenine1519-N6)-dimethyltransferase